MTLQEAFDFLNFWINKYTGAWYTIPELEQICDRGQLSLYDDLSAQYATSQRIKDALAPFRATYNFTPANTVSGVVVVPSNSNLMNLLDLQIRYTDATRTNYVSVKMYNEDEISMRLMSQIDPVDITHPIGEVIAPRYYKIYPAQGYTGTVTYFRRPAKPVFNYTIISGRVIVYNPVGSVELEFPENWQNAVLIKALSSIGINIGEQDIMQYAELKTQANYTGQNMV